MHGATVKILKEVGWGGVDWVDVAVNRSR